MKYSNVILPALLLVLAGQLMTVEVSPTAFYKNFSYGAFSVIDVTDTLSYKFKRVFYETFYSAAETERFNAIVFTGDVMLARNVEFLMLQKEAAYPFAGLNLRALAPEGAIVGNFESSMALEHKITPANNLTFSTNPLLLATLHEAGFTHLSLANNHSYDYDREGFLHTIRNLQSNNLQTFGSERAVTADSISFIETTRGRVALIGINASDGTMNLSAVLKTMAQAVEKSDMQIVYIHWGIEYDTVHHISQERLAETLVQAGADLIIGHHPHVVQDVSLVNGVPVFYSLGNFVFDQYFATNVQQGLVLVLELDDLPKIRLVPVSSLENKSQPKVMKPNLYAAYLKELAAKSDPALRENIMQGIVTFPLGVATSSKIAMIN